MLVKAKIKKKKSKQFVFTFLNPCLYNRLVTTAETDHELQIFLTLQTTLWKHGKKMLIFPVKEKMQKSSKEFALFF